MLFYGHNNEVVIFAGLGGGGGEYSLDFLVVVCVACRTGVIFWRFSGEWRQARGERGAHVTLWEGHKKNDACPNTIVHAVPAFIYECSFPIGCLMSCDHEMLLNNKMAVTSLCSVDKAI